MIPVMAMFLVKSHTDIKETNTKIITLSLELVQYKSFTILFYNRYLAEIEGSPPS